MVRWCHTLKHVVSPREGGRLCPCDMLLLKDLPGRASIRSSWTGAFSSGCSQDKMRSWVWAASCACGHPLFNNWSCLSSGRWRYVRGWFWLWFSVIAEVVLWCVSVQRSLITETTWKWVPTELGSGFPLRCWYTGWPPSTSKSAWTSLSEISLK